MTSFDARTDQPRNISAETSTARRASLSDRLTARIDLETRAPNRFHLSLGRCRAIPERECINIKIRQEQPHARTSPELYVATLIYRPNRGRRLFAVSNAPFARTAEASWLPGRAAPSPNSPTIRPRIAAYTSRRAVATRRIEPIEPHALEHQPKQLGSIPLAIGRHSSRMHVNSAFSVESPYSPLMVSARRPSGAMMVMGVLSRPGEASVSPGWSWQATWKRS